MSRDSWVFNRLKGTHFLYERAPCVHSFGVLMFGILAFHTAAQESSQSLSPETRDLITKVTRATSSASDVEDAYSELFRGADRHKLGVLKRVPEDGVALRAAWEEVRRFSLRKGVSAEGLVVKRTLADQFLGFVEGRLAIPLPGWWKRSVRYARYGIDPRKILMPAEPEPPPYHELGFGKRSVRMPKQFRLAENGESAVLTTMNRRVQLSAELVKKHLWGPISACFSDDRCYVAFHGNWGRPFPLLCLDAKTGGVLWESRVWSSGFAGGTSGSGFEYVSVVTARGRVFLIGSSLFSIYIEGFDAKTGRSSFRFATSYM